MQVDHHSDSLPITTRLSENPEYSPYNVLMYSIQRILFRVCMEDQKQTRRFGKKATWVQLNSYILEGCLWLTNPSPISSPLQCLSFSLHRKAVLPARREIYHLLLLEKSAWHWWRWPQCWCCGFGATLLQYLALFMTPGTTGLVPHFYTPCAGNASILPVPDSLGLGPKGCQNKTHSFCPPPSWTDFWFQRLV